MTDKCTLLYMTAPDAETAQRIAEALVEARLAACADIFPGVRSVYRWEGAIATDEEVAVIFKTTAVLAEAACTFIVRRHPFETPCVISLPISDAGTNPSFLTWIDEETGHG